MTDIIELAVEVSAYVNEYDSGGVLVMFDEPQLKAFAALVRKDALEEAEQACIHAHDGLAFTAHKAGIIVAAGTHCAKAINKLKGPRK